MEAQADGAPTNQIPAINFFNGAQPIFRSTKPHRFPILKIYQIVSVH
jgi:hypothetical protein